MLELEEARDRILAAVPEPAGEKIPVRQACGRILLERVAAGLDLPPFNNSSVDGFALRAADTAQAAPASPVRLKLAGRIAAGQAPAGELQPGGCIRLFTGSHLPAGADAVVMQEDTRIDPARPGEIQVLSAVQLWENVRFRGEDVQRGALILEAGEILTAGRLTLLAATGMAEVTVGRRPAVGLVATGSELREPGEPLSPGQIYECNRTGLAPLIESAGGCVKTYPIVPDALDTTRAALERSLGECDFLVTCGGVSVGELDFIKTALERLKVELQFWKVSIKPGRPFVFGRCAGKCLFGLPGNPVSAFVTFLLLVRPALLRFSGAAQTALPSSPGVLAEPLQNGGSRRHFMRVLMDPAGRVRSAGLQAAHVLSSFASANGLVDVPPRATLPAGAPVTVLRWE